MVRTTSHAPNHQVYWLDDVGPAPEFSGDLPASTDVLIVGSGYTGLNAAIETARGGRSMLVLDADDPGTDVTQLVGYELDVAIIRLRRRGLRGVLANLGLGVR